MTTRPRAADDFAAIRARMEELRRERDQTVTDPKGRSPIGSRPYHHRLESSEREPGADRILPRSGRLARSSSIFGCGSAPDRRLA